MSSSLPTLLEQLHLQETSIRQGGGAQAIERQHQKGRLTARERIALLTDDFFELGLWAAWNMYVDWGGAPSAGVVTGIGTISNRQVMIIANDATVKAGAFFPMTAKKVLRAQRIAMDNRLPLVYLVDSAGVFLPMQDEVFPDEDDFGRIFRNNAVISAAGIPQYAAILGNCVAGGGYLPVLCDKTLMTEGSGLYLAGPALVKTAIGQVATHDELGGARMHAQISGTIDFREKDDAACLERIKRLVDMLPTDARRVVMDPSPPPADAGGSQVYARGSLEQVFTGDPRHEYDVRELLPFFLDAGPFDEYKAEFGPTLVCGYGRLGGIAVGVVANQHKRSKNPRGEMQMGGVIYVDAADKAARFIMDCNQSRMPILFFQDVNGFMIGKAAEEAGIIRSGAKLVNVISNSVVPKITVILGGSYGAGNYALCGKAFDPRFIFAWPTARYAVMGGENAAGTLLDITIKGMQRKGHTPEADELDVLRRRIEADYRKETDIRYAAARLWVDAIITPSETRKALLTSLSVALRHDDGRAFKTGVLQV